MNASLALCAAVLSALPTAEPSRSTSESIYPASYSNRFAAVIRAQNPGPVLTTPMLTVPTNPGETTTMYQPGGPAYAAPSYAAPSYGSPVGPFGVPVTGNPYVTDPNYVPGTAMQENRWGFYTGYDNVFLKPYFNHNPGSIVVTPGLVGAGPNVSSRNVDWGFTYSPRVWVGLIEPNGTGMQVKYWQFDNGEDGYGGQQSLEMHVIDAEKQWHFSNRGVALSVGGGLRYADLDQKLTTSVTNGGLPEAISSDRNFNGFGPTISVSGRRRVNSTNWAMFASGRLSALYGHSSSAVIDSGNGAGVPAEATYSSGNDFIGVADLQFGVDWSAPVWAHTHFFVRIAGEGQIWLGGGLPTTPGYSAVNAPTVLTPSNTNGNLGFFGFTVGTGLTF